MCGATWRDTLFANRRPSAISTPSPQTDGERAGLTRHLARDHGYETVITDWRMTNLQAARFWPRRGFREAFLRMYRSIP